MTLLIRARAFFSDRRRTLTFAILVPNVNAITRFTTINKRSVLSFVAILIVPRKQSICAVSFSAIRTIVTLHLQFPSNIIVLHFANLATDVVYYPIEFCTILRRKFPKFCNICSISTPICPISIFVINDLLGIDSLDAVYLVLILPDGKKKIHSSCELLVLKHFDRIRVRAKSEFIIGTLWEFRVKD